MYIINLETINETSVFKWMKFKKGIMSDQEGEELYIHHRLADSGQGVLRVDKFLSNFA